MAPTLAEADLTRLRILEVDEHTSTSVVEFNGERSSRLDGFVLEGAWSFGPELLVALTSDCVYEESLYFYLFDSVLRRVDKITLLWPDQPGAFEFQRISENRVFFKFSSPDVWMLEIHQERRLRLPISSVSNGVWRPFSFFSRLGLSATA